MDEIWGFRNSATYFRQVDCVGNVMAHAQKPDFFFRRNGQVHLNRRGASVQSTTGRRGVHISLQGLYCSCKPVFCSHVTLTGYPLHSLVSPSFLLPCVTVCHHISTGLYHNYSLAEMMTDITATQFSFLVRTPFGGSDKDKLQICAKCVKD